MSEGLFTLAGVALGALGTFLLETRFRRRDEVLAARFHLTGILQWVWSDQTNYSALRSELMKLGLQLDSVGLPKGDTAALKKIAERCWNESVETEDVEDGPMISREALDGLEQLVGEIDGILGTLARPFGAIRVRRYLRVRGVTPED